ncbi:hypothetical protein HNE05_01275 [Aquipseudomonas campi]|uniref:DUF2393 domain-containing protein n=1 Tax=Aquipseudomonas campi TaxID=2731681 RepID=A0A6M8FPN3_9GAMM|nr:FxLYD domain-containing protein [Pseudomonas campi]QKE62056.1 hypothetical protein HNE05_01275 [Pseudomonas campi]
MTDNKPTLISKGFWLGIGLIIPIGFGMTLGSQLIRTSEGILHSNRDADTNYTHIATDYTKLIKIEHFKDQSQNGVIDIVGSLLNTGNEPIGSIKIEAEFFNKNGEFVMERSEYIDKKIQPQEAENFQISCDCEKQTPQDYEKITLTVTSAHNF